ncbi:MAG: hypothetical protein AAGJ40_21040 [Planctomycetota bacterium]
MTLGLTLSLALFLAPAEGSFVITFDEVGGDVVASTSGSFEIPATFVDSVAVSGIATGVSSVLGFYGDSPVAVDRYSLDANFPLNIAPPPSSASGDVFGIEGNLLFVPFALNPGDIYAPVTSWTWNSTTLDAIGLGSLTGSPEPAAAAAGLAFVFVAEAVAIPEPSMLGFVAMTSCVVARHRRRTGR